MSSYMVKNFAMIKFKLNTLHSKTVLSYNRFGEIFTRKSFHSSSKRCTAVVIDGKKISRTILDQLKSEITLMTSRNRRPPQLTTVLVGDNVVSQLYIKNKMTAAKSIGIDSKALMLPETTSQKELVQCIHDLNQNPDVDGILIQLPLPKHISSQVICNAVAPQKDVDGFHVVNTGRFCLGMNSLIPCTALGVHQLIRSTGVRTKGIHAVVCGRSKHVGWPISMLLHADPKYGTCALDATTTICHRYTPPDMLKQLTLTADILVTATGVPNLIKQDMVKEGACVIDVGITRQIDSSGKVHLCGDVDFIEVVKKAGYVTPVPGGVGPMTVAMLMKNTVQAAKQLVQYNF